MRETVLYVRAAPCGHWLGLTGRAGPRQVVFALPERCAVCGQVLARIAAVLGAETREVEDALAAYGAGPGHREDGADGVPARG